MQILSFAIANFPFYAKMQPQSISNPYIIKIRGHMKKMKIVFLANILMLALLAITGCNRNPNTVWDDTRSAGRHMHRGIRSLGGKHGSSRQVGSRNEFMPGQEAYAGEFIPLADDPNRSGITAGDMVAPPPRESPGEPGSSIPGIDAFHDPSMNPEWARTFKNITFDYNSSLIKGAENLNTIRDIANYMRQYPNLYIFVEGHCDERGPEAYNLALGSHRANAVRNMLIGDGVHPDNIFTISYGKERPLVYGTAEESWRQNRRAEFKIFVR